MYNSNYTIHTDVLHWDNRDIFVLFHWASILYILHSYQNQTAWDQSETYTFIIRSPFAYNYISNTYIFFLVFW